MGYMYNNRSYNRPGRYEDDDKEYKDRNRQRHVHEVQGSVELADGHTHRFATVTDEACPYDSDHYHEVKFRTDFVDGHYHEFCGKTSGAVKVGDRHVHFLKSVTSIDDGHSHEFRAATMIEEPNGDRKSRKY